MENNTKRNLIILGVILLILIVSYIVIDKFINNNQDEYSEYLKNYEVNEYITTYVSDEDMAKIYLNDYVHMMYSNVEEAYNHLDEEYRQKKFGSLDAYKNYVNSLNYSSYTLSRYYKNSIDGYIIFGVYDTNDNLFIFKTKGVMQYTVYLDDYTVEI